MHGVDKKVIVPLLTASFLAYGYNNIFMVLTPLFSRDIGASVTEAGLQGAMFLVVAVILRFYFGPLADRRGAKFIMVLGLLAFATGGFLFLFCAEYWQVLLIRSIQAIGISAFFPGATALVARSVVSERRGFFLGVYRFVVSLSLLFGPWSALFLVEIGGYTFFFLVMVLCSSVALVLVLLLPTQRVMDARSGQQRSGLRILLKTFREALHENPFVIAVVLGVSFCAALGYGLIFSFASLFITDIRPETNTGFYFTLIGVGGLVANLFVGWLSDKMSRNSLLIICLVCMAIGVGFLGLLVLSESMFWISGLLVGFGYAGMVTTALGVVSTKVSEDHRTSIFALQQNGVDLGIACASGGFGLIFAVVPDASIVFIAQGIVMFVVALVVILFKKKDPPCEDTTCLK